MADYIQRGLAGKPLIGSTPVILWEQGWDGDADITGKAALPDRGQMNRGLECLF